jgi:hypothetical protein
MRRLKSIRNVCTHFVARGSRNICPVNQMRKRRSRVCFYGFFFSFPPPPYFLLHFGFAEVATKAWGRKAAKFYGGEDTDDDGGTYHMIVA